MRDYIKNVIIAKHEQGYQVYPEDKGNYVDGKLIGTNLGISAPALKQYLGRTPTVKDMKGLKLKTALDILENEYYKRPKIDKLPISIRKNVLDMAINAGPKRAIKILQRLVGAKQDGAIGPKTLKKLRESKITNNDYVDARRDYYLRLIERKPIYKKFRNGWLNRVESFRDKKPVKVVQKSIKVEEEEEDFSEDQKFDSPEEFERSKDEDIAIEQKKIIQEAKKPEQEIKAEDIQLEETIPMDQSVPFGVYAQGSDEFEMAEEQEKDKLMMAAEGGEVRYQEGGEVDVPEYLRRPEEDIEEEEFKVEDVTEMDLEEPDPFPKRDRSPDFQGVREYQLSQMSTDELMKKRSPGAGRAADVNRELRRRRRDFGIPVSQIAELEKEEVVDVKVPKPEPEPKPARLSKTDFLEIRKLRDEKELRKAEDDSKSCWFSSRCLWFLQVWYS